MRRMRIISGGHVVIPAAIQKRWGTHCVEMEDREDHIVLRPVPDVSMDASGAAGWREETATIDAARNRITR